MKKFGGIIAAVVAVVAVVIAVIVWPRGTTEVTEDDALEDFRNRATTTSTTADEAPDDDASDTDDAATDLAGNRPQPGVYTYASSGTEVVKLGPLPQENRPLPASITAVSVDVDDACFDFTINLFAEHRETNRYCASGGELVLSQHTKNQTVGAISPTATMTCDPNVLRGGVSGSSSEAASRETVCTLNVSGGPISVDAQLSGTVVEEASEVVRVGDDEVETTPVVLTLVAAGSITGGWTETIYFADNNLPVKVVRDLDLQGPATFTEQSELVLTSLTPTAG
ncbi:MAG: hypothetical protein M9952_16290 [Microthrixaceae bacterium]|nr:hypothetical protein [Microthrixaceae bacterium]